MWNIKIKTYYTVVYYQSRSLYLEARVAIKYMTMLLITLTINRSSTMAVALLSNTLFYHLDCANCLQWQTQYPQCIFISKRFTWDSYFWFWSLSLLTNTCICSLHRSAFVPMFWFNSTYDSVDGLVLYFFLFYICLVKHLRSMFLLLLQCHHCNFLWLVLIQYIQMHLIQEKGLNGLDHTHQRRCGGSVALPAETLQHSVCLTA